MGIFILVTHREDILKLRCVKRKEEEMFV